MTATPVISMLGTLPEDAPFGLDPEQLREVVGRLPAPAARRFGAHLFFEHIKAIARAVRDRSEMDIDFNALLCQLDSRQREGYLLAWRWWSAVHVVGGDFDGDDLFEDFECGGGLSIAVWDNTSVDDAAMNAAHWRGVHLFLDHLWALFDSAHATSGGAEPEISVPDLAAPVLALTALERAGYLEAWELWSVIVAAGGVPDPDWLLAELEKAASPARPDAEETRIAAALTPNADADAEGGHHVAR